MTMAMTTSKALLIVASIIAAVTLNETTIAAAMAAETAESNAAMAAAADATKRTDVPIRASSSMTSVALSSSSSSPAAEWSASESAVADRNANADDGEDDDDDDDTDDYGADDANDARPAEKSDGCVESKLPSSSSAVAAASSSSSPSSYASLLSAQKRRRNARHDQKHDDEDDDDDNDNNDGHDDDNDITNRRKKRTLRIKVRDTELYVDRTSLAEGRRFGVDPQWTSESSSSSTTSKEGKGGEKGIRNRGGSGNGRYGGFFNFGSGFGCTGLDYCHGSMIGFGGLLSDYDDLARGNDNQEGINGNGGGGKTTRSEFQDLDQPGHDDSLNGNDGTQYHCNSAVYQTHVVGRGDCTGRSASHLDETTRRQDLDYGLKRRQNRHHHRHDQRRRQQQQQQRGRHQQQTQRRDRGNIHDDHDHQHDNDNDDHDHDHDIDQCYYDNDEYNHKSNKHLYHHHNNNNNNRYDDDVDAHSTADGARLLSAALNALSQTIGLVADVARATGETAGAAAGSSARLMGTAVSGILGRALDDVGDRIEGKGAEMRNGGGGGGGNEEGGKKVGEGKGGEGEGGGRGRMKMGKSAEDGGDVYHDYIYRKEESIKNTKNRLAGRKNGDSNNRYNGGGRGNNGMKNERSTWSGRRVVGRSVRLMGKVVRGVGDSLLLAGNAAESIASSAASVAEDAFRIAEDAVGSLSEALASAADLDNMMMTSTLATTTTTTTMESKESTSRICPRRFGDKATTKRGRRFDDDDDDDDDDDVDGLVRSNADGDAVGANGFVSFGRHTRAEYDDKHDDDGDDKHDDDGDDNSIDGDVSYSPVPDASSSSSSSSLSFGDTYADVASHVRDNWNDAVEAMANEMEYALSDVDGVPSPAPETLVVLVACYFLSVLMLRSGGGGGDGRRERWFRNQKKKVATTTTDGKDRPRKLAGTTRLHRENIVGIGNEESVRRRNRGNVVVSTLPKCHRPRPLDHDDDVDDVHDGGSDCGSTCARRMKRGSIQAVAEPMLVHAIVRDAGEGVGASPSDRANGAVPPVTTATSMATHPEALAAAFAVERDDDSSRASSISSLDKRVRWSSSSSSYVLKKDGLIESGEGANDSEVSSTANYPLGSSFGSVSLIRKIFGVFLFPFRIAWHAVKLALRIVFSRQTLLLLAYSIGWIYLCHVSRMRYDEIQRRSEVSGFRSAIVSVGTMSGPAQLAESALWLNAVLKRAWRVPRDGARLPSINDSKLYPKIVRRAVEVATSKCEGRRSPTSKFDIGRKFSNFDGKDPSGLGYGGLEPYLSSVIGAVLLDTLETTGESRPSDIAYVSLYSFTLGSEPPVFRSIEFRGSGRDGSVARFDVELDAFLRDASLEIDIKLSSLDYALLPSTRLSINAMDVRFPLALAVEFTPDFPYVSKVNVSLARVPACRVKITPLSDSSGLRGVDLGSLPVLSNWVQKALQDSLASYLFPSFISFDIASLVRSPSRDLLDKASRPDHSVLTGETTDFETKANKSRANPTLTALHHSTSRAGEKANAPLHEPMEMRQRLVGSDLSRKTTHQTAEQKSTDITEKEEPTRQQQASALNDIVEPLEKEADASNKKENLAECKKESGEKVTTRMKRFSNTMAGPLKILGPVVFGLIGAALHDLFMNNDDIQS